MRLIPEVVERPLNPIERHFISAVVGTAVAPLMTWLNLNRITLNRVDVPQICCSNPTMSVFEDLEGSFPAELTRFRITIVRQLAGIMAAVGIKSFTVEVTEDDKNKMKEALTGLLNADLPDKIETAVKPIEEVRQEDSGDGMQNFHCEPTPALESKPDVVDSREPDKGSSQYVENMVLSAVSQLLPVHGRDYEIKNIKSFKGGGGTIPTSVTLVGKSAVGVKFAEAVNEILPEIFKKYNDKKGV